jgi:hypothetical protein
MMKKRTPFPSIPPYILRDQQQKKNIIGMHSLVGPRQMTLTGDGARHPSALTGEGARRHPAEWYAPPNKETRIGYTNSTITS